MPGSPLSLSQCQELVLQYEPAVVRLFVQMMDPTFVCTVSVPTPRVAPTEMGILCPSLWAGSGPGWSEAPRGGFFPLPLALFLCNAENQSL